MHVRIFVGLVLAMALLLIPTSASAHEGREIGDMELVVGLAPEPAVANSSLQVQVFLREHPSEKPIVLNEKQLKGLASHLFVGKLDGTPEDADYKAMPNRAMPLQAAFDSPGEYLSEDPFIPTGPVTVSLHLATKDGVKIHGQTFNEVFVSGPGTFGPIKDDKKLTIPGSPPSQTELQAKDVALETKVVEAQDDATGALWLVGIIAGLGLIVGGTALFLARREVA